MSLRKKLMFGCCVVLVVLAVWVLLSGPMLVNLKAGPLPGDRHVIVLNPIRDRAPERYASGVLSGVQSAKCTQAVTELGISAQQKVAACSKQEQDPVTDVCQLVERSDKGTSTWLLFHCPYQRPTDARAEIALTLDRSGNQWQLHSYERIY
jgi:hypothetical protein